MFKSNQRLWNRIKCLTLACWNDGELKLIGEWQSNDYCKYIEVLCPTCLATYWMVKRDEKYELRQRKDGQTFDHRKSNRKDS